MMKFNGNTIRVFSQEYAYNLSTKRIAIDGTPQLQRHIEYSWSEYPQYNEGDTFPREIWNIYPKDIAIIVHEQGRYMLQTCSNYRVGKLYNDIIENENEIRHYFKEHQGDLLLLENSLTARSIKPDYESLIAYTEIMEEANNQAAKISHLFWHCKQINNSLQSYQNNLPSDSQERIDFICELTDNFIKIMRENKLVSNQETERKFDKITLPFYSKRALAIIFAVFYHNYQNEKELNNKYGSYCEIIDAFKEFVYKNPEAIDCFCVYSNQHQIDKSELLKELKNANSTQTYLDALANSILS